MYEVENVQQDHEKLKKRWFNDRYSDLYIWQDDSETIHRFQFFYRNGDKEIGVQWEDGKMSQGMVVDHSETSVFKNLSPTMTMDATMDKYEVLFLFRYRSILMMNAISEFVEEKILEWSNC